MNEKFDFTNDKLLKILRYFIDKGYSFQSLEDFIKNPFKKVVILRHDVDRNPINSLRTAKLEKSENIRGTYYFRIVKNSNDPNIIKEIAALGHEIGYHYEDLALSKGNYKDAITTFKSNLEYFRTFYPVSTICMHGSPISKWDNRDLWKKYSYKNFGIIAEPYFDLDFNNLLYLTDSGRKWNGEKFAVRDKVFQRNFQTLKNKLKTSDHIISAVKKDELPNQIMLTIHPQRWTDEYFLWLWELVSQNLKNSVKILFFKT